jgi:thioredoxin 1
LQNKNAATVVFVDAPWCPVWRAQEQVLQKLVATPEYKDVNILTIDFDSQKALWSRFGARQQSTLIGFHGRRETARLSYNADADKVTAVIASTLR